MDSVLALDFSVTEEQESGILGVRMMTLMMTVVVMTIWEVFKKVR